MLGGLRTDMNDVEKRKRKGDLLEMKAEWNTNSVAAIVYSRYNMWE
jgi:hypothetical protein